MVIKSSNDAIVVTTIDGVVTYWNPAAERLYGYSADEAISQSLMVLVGPDRADEVRRVMTQLLRGEPITSYETERRTRDGRRVVIWVSMVPIKDRDGSLVGVASFGRDFTEQRRLEQGATRAQRLEAAGEVAGQVAHDIGNLLAPIAGLPEIIRDLLPPDHPAAAYCDMITEAANAMAAINEDLLALGRRGQTQFVAVDLNAVVREAVGYLSAGSTTMDIELDLEAGLPLVNGVWSQLLRMVMNLLTNARDAVTGGGRIKVRTTATSIPESDGDNGQAQPGTYVRLQVADTGTGIPPEITERIFEPFFTTKDRGVRPGSGLGLSVVRAMVSDHGGTIEVTSRVGVGTTFTILLPPATSPTDAT
jgi:two-component system, cell cycle sensor histidine kinase and response regulator CckA